MIYWLAIAVSALAAAGGFYMAWLMSRTEDGSGLMLFLAFGCLFSIPVVAALVKVAARRFRAARLAEQALDRDIVPGFSAPRPTFVPHAQLIAIIIIAVLGILAAILVPRLFR